MPDMSKYTDEQIRNMYENSLRYQSDDRMKNALRNQVATNTGRKSKVAIRTNKAVKEVMRLVAIEFEKRGLKP